MVSKSLVKGTAKILKAMSETGQYAPEPAYQEIEESTSKVAAAELRPIGDLIDEGYVLETRLSDLRRQLRALEAQQDAISAELQVRLTEEMHLKGAAGAKGRFERQTRDLPIINDFGKFTAYVKKTERWELFQRQLGQRNVMAHLEELSASKAKSKEIPGVEVITKESWKFKALRKK